MNSILKLVMPHDYSLKIPVFLIKNEIFANNNCQIFVLVWVRSENHILIRWETFFVVRFFSEIAIPDFVKYILTFLTPTFSLFDFANTSMPLEYVAIFFFKISWCCSPRLASICILENVYFFFSILKRRFKTSAG